MAYVNPNFKTKKALREAVLKGDKVTVFQVGPWGGKLGDGVHSIEGPHKYHTWYARVTVKEGRVVGVK